MCNVKNHRCNVKNHCEKWMTREHHKNNNLAMVYVKSGSWGFAVFVVFAFGWHNDFK